MSHWTSCGSPMKSGLIYTGIIHATSYEKEFGLILKMARLIKDGNFRGQKTVAEFVSKPPSRNFIIPASELVQVTAKEVAVNSDGLANELQRDKQQELMIDSLISQTCHAEERELEPWIPDADAPQLPELDNIFDDPRNRLSSMFSSKGEAQTPQSGTGSYLYHSVPYDGRRTVSENHSRSFSTLDSESRVQENLLCEHGGNNDAKDFVEKQLPPEDAQLLKSVVSLWCKPHAMFHIDSQSSPNSEMDVTGKVGQSANATSYSTSHVLSKGNEKTSSHGEPLEAAVSSKAPGESQSVNSLWRPGSSALSNADRAQCF